MNEDDKSSTNILSGLGADAQERFQPEDEDDAFIGLDEAPDKEIGGRRSII